MRLLIWMQSYNIMGRWQNFKRIIHFQLCDEAREF